jgi:uncharacterized protein (TIGR03437 family)
MRRNVLALLLLALCLGCGEGKGQSIINTFAGGHRTFMADGQLATTLSIAKVSFVTLDLNGNSVFAVPSLNVVLRVNPDGTVTHIAGTGASGYSGDHGPATSATLRAPTGVAYDAAGNLYIADTFNYVVREVSSVDGTITTIAGQGEAGYSGNNVPATQALLNTPTALVFDSINNILYINDAGNGVIRRVMNGSIVTYAGAGRETGTSCAPSPDNVPATTVPFCDPEGIALDTAGNLYVADFADNRVRKVDFNTQRISTVAGTGQAGYAPDGSVALQSPLRNPGGVAIDASGSIYIAESGNETIRKVTGGILATVAGNTVPGYSGDQQPALRAELNTPFGLMLDTAGDLYFADRDNFRVRKVDTKGLISTLAGNGTSSLSSVIPASDLPLSLPFGVGVGPDGSVYVADTNSDVIRKILPDGLAFTVAGTGAAEYSGNGGPATSAGLITPRNVAFDSKGNLYIADFGSNRVREVDANGNISTVAGNGSAPYNGDGILATEASLSGPSALAFDGMGNLYIADTGNHRVRMVSNGVISTFVGTGTAGVAGENVSGSLAELDMPVGLAFDPSGNLFIGDSTGQLNGGRVRKVTPGGIVSTYAGGGNLSGTQADGQAATSAALELVESVATDATGNVYFADAAGNMVRMVSPQGIISTIAGNGIGGYAGDGGAAALAELNSPTGVAIDAAGNMFIAEYGDDRVRIVYSSSTPRTIQASPNSLTFSGSSGGLPTSTQTVMLTSSIAGLLFSIDVTPASSWLTATPVLSSSIAQLPAQLNVTANPSGLPPGPYSGNIAVTSVLADPPVQNIAVHFTVAPAQPPVVSLEPNQIAFSFARQSARASQSFRVLNGGGGKLVFSASTATGNGVSWLSISPSNGSATPAQPATIIATADPTGLAPGTYAGAITVKDTNGSDTASVAVTMTISTTPQAMLVSQTGLTFVGVQNGGEIPAQTFEIINSGQGDMDWSVAPKTLGAVANWLVVKPSKGTSTGGITPPAVTVTVDPSGLAPGIHYEQIVVTSPTAVNSPQLLTIVFDLLTPDQDPGPIVEPTGLFFTAVAGGADPDPQAFLVSNLATSPILFGSSQTFVPQGSWFVHSPLNGTVSPNSPLTITVSPHIGGLAPGVYLAQIALLFSDGYSRTVEIRLVVAPGAASPGSLRPHETPSCVPTKWVPLFTTLTDNFAVDAGWPATVIVEVFDDCANPMTSGSVTVSFSNGEQSLQLIPLLDGSWSNTWPAVNASLSTILTATAFSMTPPPPLQGTTTINGEVLQNPNPPVVSPGGVVSAASSTSGAPLAQGSLISIYGSQLADSAAIAAGLPLETNLNDVQVYIGATALPLLYVSPGQINAIIPYSLPANTSAPLLVQRGAAATLSAVVPIQIAGTQPAVFLVGPQQGAIVDQNNVLLGPANPTKAADTIVIFCTGLGPVTGGVPAGTPSPSSPLARTTNVVSVTIGGQSASVSFSGLAPGFVGLYQVNVIVPQGAQSGNSVSVVLQAGGLASTPVSIPIQN